MMTINVWVLLAKNTRRALEVLSTQWDELNALLFGAPRCAVCALRGCVDESHTWPEATAVVVAAAPPISAAAGVSQPTDLMSTLAMPSFSAEWRGFIAIHKALIIGGAAAIGSIGVVYYLAHLTNETTMRSEQMKCESKRKVESVKAPLRCVDELLTMHERKLAQCVIAPEAGVEWSEIGGHLNLKQQLRERLIVPLQLMQVNNTSELLAPAKGVLLYGPPGCGKTLLARAIAKAANARCINVQVSELRDRWYGESEKYVSALFSLARKMQPCIIFIDEIDALLRTRAASDYETTALIKTQFMSQWDGFDNDTHSTVIVLGATNRPHDIDEAIMRRMPLRFHVGLPDQQQRVDILKVHLSKERCDESVDLDVLASQCDGMSGSDLKEVCRIAAQQRVQKILERHSYSDGQFSDELKEELVTMQLTQEHLLYGVDNMQQSLSGYGELLHGGLVERMR